MIFLGCHTDCVLIRNIYHILELVLECEISYYGKMTNVINKQFCLVFQDGRNLLCLQSIGETLLYIQFCNKKKLNVKAVYKFKNRKEKSCTNYSLLNVIV